jgi:oxygen-dependent protoporphyrinogen oxidase
MTIARVVGAGVSGLTAAWHLSQAGFDVEVVDAAPRAGGLIETLVTPLGLVELGANAYVWTETTADVFRALDITPRFASAAARRRFIFRDGAIHRWPLRAGETVSMVVRRARAGIRRDAAPGAGESVAEWSGRVYGPGATQWLVGAALQGIYGAPAARLSAEAIAGLGAGPLRGRRSILGAPPRGMSELMDRMVDRLERRGVTIALGCSVATLEPSVPTIVATSAPAAAPLITPHAPGLGAALAALPMTSLSMTTAFFPRNPADIEGFGVLFPAGCGFRSLGVRFDSDIFPGPDARVETWIGQLDDESTSAFGDSQWPSSVAADRLLLTGRAEAPLAVVTTCRPQALPLYSGDVVSIRRQLPTLPPWIALAGNYMGRLGASKLLEVAAEAAARIARYNAGAGLRTHQSSGRADRPGPESAPGAFRRRTAG